MAKFGLVTIKNRGDEIPDREKVFSFITNFLYNKDICKENLLKCIENVFANNLFDTSEKNMLNDISRQGNSILIRGSNKAELSQFFERESKAVFTFNNIFVPTGRYDENYNKIYKDITNLTIFWKSQNLDTSKNNSHSENNNSNKRIEALEKEVKKLREELNDLKNLVIKNLSK